VRIGSLFSGIGGLELGLERATGGRTAWQVEIDAFPRRVLARHWPDAERRRDVRAFASLLESSFCARRRYSVEILCGGFPCQDLSVAGRGVGLGGERSGLFFDLMRIVRALRPRIVVLENVAALLARWLGGVLTDAIESSSLPTPSASDYGSNQSQSSGAAVRPSLQTMARGGMLPTPTETMADTKGDLIGHLRGTRGSRMLPTPAARDWKDGTQPRPHGRHSDSLPVVVNREVGGSLHPQFVEWMMGFPKGWTDLDGDDR
jgi:hypothetical protein